MERVDGEGVAERVSGKDKDCDTKRGREREQ